MDERLNEQTFTQQEWRETLLITRIDGTTMATMMYRLSNANSPTTAETTTSANERSKPLAAWREQFRQLSGRDFDYSKKANPTEFSLN